MTQGLIGDPEPDEEFDSGAIPPEDGITADPDQPDVADDQGDDDELQPDDAPLEASTTEPTETEDPQP